MAFVDLLTCHVVSYAFVISRVIGIAGHFPYVGCGPHVQIERQKPGSSTSCTNVT